MVRTTLLALTLLTIPWGTLLPPVHAKESPADLRGKAITAVVTLASLQMVEELKTDATTSLDVSRSLADNAEDAALLTRIAALPDQGDAKGSSKVRKLRSAAIKALEKLAASLAKKDETAEHALVQMSILLLDPSLKRIKKMGGAAKKDIVIFRCAKHPFAAHVSFPKQWKPSKTWPVLVCVDGAGAGFLGCARRFASTRGKHPYIVVSPHAMSCTNAIDIKKFPAYSDTLAKEWDSKRAEFDTDGLIALLDVLHQHFGASNQVAMTGFSGGGLLTYSMLLQHPDRVLCAAPACANYQSSLARGAKKVQEGGPRVHIMTGEKDPHRHLTHGKTPPGIETQTDEAEKALKENGLTRVKRSLLPGVGHSPLTREVWEFVVQKESK